MLVGLGFVVMIGASAASAGGALVSPMWLVLTYLLHTLGELTLSPVGLSAMTKLAPARVSSLMMGVWFLGASVGNFLAGFVASFSESLEGPSFFGFIAAIAILSGLVFFFAAGPFKRLLAKAEIGTAPLLALVPLSSLRPAGRPGRRGRRRRAPCPTSPTSPSPSCRTARAWTCRPTPSPGPPALDLRAAVPTDAPLTLAPGAFALVPTGLQIALPEGTEGQVRPRSGLAFRHGVTVLNSPGTIDSSYRGEVGVLLVNHGPKPFEVTRGERIAQLVVARYLPVRLVEADALPETARGAGGFGSTGTA